LTAPRTERQPGHGGRFGSAAAFKASLDAHPRKLAAERRVPLSTLQIRFVIERLLARLFRAPEPPWLLKGGFAMDLWFRPRARATKDVDLSIALAPDALPVDFSGVLRERIQEVADVDLSDYLTYRIGTPRHELTDAPWGGVRSPCEAILVGKTYARFHIDVGCGDALVGEPERILGDDLLAFAGIPPAEVLVVSRSQQFAEKIHAYSFPWSGRVNTRTKDLVDLVLLIERGLPTGPGSGRPSGRRSRHGRPIPFPLRWARRPSPGRSTFRPWRPSRGCRRATTSKRSRSSAHSGTRARSERLAGGDPRDFGPLIRTPSDRRRRPGAPGQSGGGVEATCFRHPRGLDRSDTRRHAHREWVVGRSVTTGVGRSGGPLMRRCCEMTALGAIPAICSSFQPRTTPVLLPIFIDWHTDAP
jgi:Nucleotidyl transferase AbiEii toxin, Type IV TA system